jgi:hypothetical protein
MKRRGSHESTDFCAIRGIGVSAIGEIRVIRVIRVP